MVFKRPFFLRKRENQNKIKKFDHNRVTPQQFQEKNILPKTAPSCLSKAPMVLKKNLDFSHHIFKIYWFFSQRRIVRLYDSQLSVSHQRICLPKLKPNNQKPIKLKSRLKTFLFPKNNATLKQSCFTHMIFPYTLHK